MFDKWYSIPKVNPSVFPPELRPRDGEPADSVPQAERFGEEPPELHPGQTEGRTLRRTSFAEATQRLPHLGGGSDRCSQEPAGLARQVETTLEAVELDNISIFQQVIIRKIYLFYANVRAGISVIRNE